MGSCPRDEQFNLNACSQSCDCQRAGPGVTGASLTGAMLLLDAEGTKMAASLCSQITAEAATGGQTQDSPQWLHI